MQSKIAISLGSLSNWTEDLILQGKEYSRDTDSFSASINLKDYLEFYNELFPFVDALKANKNPVIAELAAEFRPNYESLLDSLRSYGTLLNLESGLFGDSYSRGMGDALIVLADISNNLKNLLYQFKINAD